MNSRMTVGAFGVAAPQTQMEYWQGDMTTEALVLDPLKGKHMPVGRSVRLVTGDATFDLQAAVLE